MSQTEPQSPCISVCVLDDQDICVGCYRSAMEITDWFMANNEGKLDILTRSQQRRDDDNPIRFK